MSVNSPLRAALLCATAHITCFGLGSFLIRTPFVSHHAASILGTTPSAMGIGDVIGVCLWLTGCVLGPTTVSSLLSALGAERSLRWPLIRIKGCRNAALLVAIACSSFSALCTFVLVQPHLVFHTQPPTDVLLAFLGGLAAIIYLGCAVVSAVVSFRFSSRETIEESPPSVGPATIELASLSARGIPLSPRPTSALLGSPRLTLSSPAAATPRSLKGPVEAAELKVEPPLTAWSWPHIGDTMRFDAVIILLGLGAISLLSFVGVVLPAHFDQPLFDWLRVQDADDSIIATSIIWHVGKAPSDDEALAGLVTPLIVPKLFLDDLVFTAVSVFIVIAGAVCSHSAAGRKVVRRRVGFGPCSMSVGEAALYATIVSLFAFDAWYWLWGASGRILAVAGDEADAMSAGFGDDEKFEVLSRFGAAARVTGHLASLSVALTLLPAARSSLWESAFGVPFTRAVALHRRLGEFAWILVAIHMLTWWGKWAAERTLLANAFASTGGLFVFPLSPDGLHVNNFTIPVVEAAFALLTGSLVLALAYRRVPGLYKHFRSAHAAAVRLFVLAALLHAWGFWKRAALGLLLLGVDAAIRATRAASRQTSPIALELRGGVVRLVVDSSSLLGAPARGVCVPRPQFFAGQSALLSFASSPTDQHPFSIATSPTRAAATGCIEFFIRVQPQRSGTTQPSWTEQLAAAATQFLAAKSLGLVPPDLVIAAEGPHGRSACRYHEHGALLIVAGGAGISACLSLFEDLLLRATAAADAEDVATAAAVAELAASEDASEEVRAALASRVVATAEPSPLGTLKRVILVWSVRTGGAGLVSLAEATLLAALRLHETHPRLAPVFEVLLSCSDHDPTAAAAPFSGVDDNLRACFTSGRPNFEAAIASCAVGARIAVWACAPRAMVEAAVAASGGAGEVHEESWEL